MAWCRTLGFTGTIGSGKSARVEHLRCLIPSLAARTADEWSGKQGQEGRLPWCRVEVLSADKVGHQVYAPGTACYHQVVDTFGPAILHPKQTPSGLAEINRAALGKIVFSNPVQLHTLNRLCWPHISNTILRTHETLRRRTHDEAVGGGAVLFILLEAALLVELPSLLGLCQDVWVTHCDEDVAVRRVASRDRLDDSAALQRIRAQRTSAELHRHLEAASFSADHVHWLDTSSCSLEEGLMELTRDFSRYWENQIVSAFSAASSNSSG